MNTSPILQFLFSTEWNVLNDALNMSSPYEQISALSAAEVSTLLTGRSSCLIITAVRGKSDLIQLATLAKNMKNIRECVIKLVVVNFSGNLQIEKAIDKLGIQDVIEERINTKALKFKIDFWMKALNVQIKNNNAIKEAKSFKSADNSGAKAVDKKNLDHIPVWDEPIDCENDIWLLRNDSDAKKILTRWLIKIIGPSPYIGTWIEVANRTGVWKFDVKSESRDEFMSANGSWFFRGDQKPDFVWKENTWLITGNSFELFHQDNDLIHSRLKLDRRTLKIAKNSEFAKTKEEIILESFDKDLMFKKESTSFGGVNSVDGHETEKLKNLSGVNKTDQIENKNLSGKGSTDQIDQKNLSGKSNTSKLNTDPLAMDLKNNEDDLGGKQLSQKMSTSKMTLTMSGKNSRDEAYDDSGSSVTSDKHREGAELDIENKNHEYEMYMRGHNEAEKFDASDKLGKKGEKTPLEPTGEMSGKSSTERLSSHMGNPQKEKEATVTAGAKESLSGRSSTDKLPSHLGKTQTTKEATDAAEEKDLLGGKTSNEKLKGHLSGRTKDGKKEGEQDGSFEKESSRADAKERSGKAAAANDSVEGAENEKGLAPTTKERAEREQAVASDAKNPYSGKSGTEKIERHMGSGNGHKTATAEAKKPKESSVPEELEAGRVDGKFKDQIQAGKAKPEFDNAGVQESASLYSLAKAREEKLKNNINADEEEEIRRATEDAIVNSVITFNNKKFSCNLDDFFDGKIIFETPEDGLLAASRINLDLSFKYQKKDTKLAITAAIESVDKDEEGNNFITVALISEHIKSFEAFMKLYQERQSNVDLFLKKAKGY